MNVHEKHRAIAHAAPPDSITREELEQLRKDAEIGSRWREKLEKTNIEIKSDDGGLTEQDLIGGAS